MAVRHSGPFTFRKYSMTRRAVSFIVGLNLPAVELVRNWRLLIKERCGIYGVTC